MAHIDLSRPSPTRLALQPQFTTVRNASDLREAHGLILVSYELFARGSVLFHNAFVTSALALHTPIAQSSSRP